MTLTTHSPLTVTLGSSGVTPEDVVASPATTRRSPSPRTRSTPSPRSAPTSTTWPTARPRLTGSPPASGLANRHIPNELRTQLQKSLIRSHAAGMGPAVEREVVRGIMFLRAKTLASGRTGVRPVVLQTMVDVLNAGITPRWSVNSARSAARATSRRSRTALWSPDGRRRSDGPDGQLYGGKNSGKEAAPSPSSLPNTGSNPSPGRKGGPGPGQRDRGHARHAADGDRGPPPAALTTADITAAPQRRGAARTDQVFPARAARRAAAAPGQAASADNMLRVLPTPRSWPHTGSTTPRSRTLLAALRPQVAGARP